MLSLLILRSAGGHWSHYLRALQFQEQRRGVVCVQCAPARFLVVIFTPPSKLAPQPSQREPLVCLLGKRDFLEGGFEEQLKRDLSLLEGVQAAGSFPDIQAVEFGLSCFS